jgi:hypothetical protein
VILHTGGDNIFFLEYSRRSEEAPPYSVKRYGERGEALWWVAPPQETGLIGVYSRETCLGWEHFFGRNIRTKGGLLLSPYTAIQPCVFAYNCIACCIVIHKFTDIARVNHKERHSWRGHAKGFDGRGKQTGSPVPKGRNISRRTR